MRLMVRYSVGPFLFLFSCCPLLLFGETRVALVSCGATETTEKLLSLATVKLSQSPDLVVLERKEIEQILTEHELIVAGSVDAENAIRLGQVLAVDIFAVIECDPVLDRVAGMVVFDGGTGLRLCDITIPDKPLDNASAILLEAVTLSLKKHRQKEQGLEFVSVLPVRSTELSRNLDGFCDAVGRLVERFLTGSEQIALLERKRLVNVLDEKALAESTESRPREDSMAQEFLLTSTLQIGIEIAPTVDGKLTASVQVSRANGDLVCEYNIEEAELDAPRLAKKVGVRLLDVLRVHRGAHLASRNDEGRRFAAEARFLANQNRTGEALKAIEAALALCEESEYIRLRAVWQARLALELLKELPNGVMDLEYAAWLLAQAIEVNNSTENTEASELDILLLRSEVFINGMRRCQLYPVREAGGLFSLCGRFRRSITKQKRCDALHKDACASSLDDIPLPWNKATVLFRWGTLSAIWTVVEPYLYVMVGIGQDGDKYDKLRLHRVSLLDETTEQLCFIDRHTMPSRMWIDNKYVYLSGGGFQVFSLGGGCIVDLKEGSGIPRDHVNALARAGDKLLIALTPGWDDQDLSSYLLLLDMKTGECRTLVATTRKHKQNPLDEKDKLAITDMAVSPDGGRLMFALEDGEKWQFDVRSDELKKTSSMADGLRLNSAPFPCQYIASIKVGHDLWTAEPFGRRIGNTNRFQEFPVSFHNCRIQMVHHMELVNHGKDVIVGGYLTVVMLHLTEPVATVKNTRK